MQSFVRAAICMPAKGMAHARRGELWGKPAGQINATVRGKTTLAENKGMATGGSGVGVGRVPGGLGAH